MSCFFKIRFEDFYRAQILYISYTRKKIRYIPFIVLGLILVLFLHDLIFNDYFNLFVLLCFLFVFCYISFFRWKVFKYYSKKRWIKQFGNNKDVEISLEILDNIITITNLNTQKMDIYNVKEINNLIENKEMIVIDLLPKSIICIPKDLNSKEEVNNLKNLLTL